MLGVERINPYELFYGLMLNEKVDVAKHAVATSWGNQATLTGVPNLLMFEAESDCDGADAGQRMNDAVANAKLQEGMQTFKDRFGMK